ncbi:MAG: hypothetical protein EA396_11820 [Anaerolineaceae bacterium]|nr:MAG: hypothetical protein EA396_11820 [Anaerolineaceae bacterium]
MPIYEPDHIEYSITDGMIGITLDDGTRLPAYWAHPTLGNRFPGAVLVHDWWGLTDIVRRMAALFAQMGHYVIAPDLFGGEQPKDNAQAMALIEQTRDSNYQQVSDALDVLRNHHQCNKSMAVIGIGMGGSLAFEAAIKREDLQAAVAYAGFPHRFIGKFAQANTPICAFYGENEPHIKSRVIQQMRQQMLESAERIPHEIHIIPRIAHDFFSTELSPEARQVSRGVLKSTFDFLDNHLKPPKRAGDRKRY